MHTPTSSMSPSQETDLLEEKAALLYPDNPAMQIKWINAINYLRGGKARILDTFVQRKDTQ